MLAKDHDLIEGVAPINREQTAAADTSAPTVSSVTLSPAKSSYQPNELVTITWVSSDNVGVVTHDVLFSPTGQPPFEPVVSNLPGSQQSYAWAIPNQITDTAAVRVVARDAAGNQGGKRSDPFKIAAADTTAPVVSAVTLSPAKSNYLPGEAVTITWGSADEVGVVAHDVLFSPSGQQPFEPVVSNLPGTQQSYAWAIPNQITDTAAVRVVARDAAGNQGGKRSDPFKITAADTTAPTVSSVTLSPAKSSYQVGEAVTITWVSADNIGVVAHDVLFSPSGEPPFTPIVSNLPGAQQSYTWTMPSPATPNAAVRVVARDAAGNQGGKRSDPFAISTSDSITLKVFSVTPAEGATTGGRSITVKGANFVKGVSLFLGGVPAQNVRFIDTQTLSAETPARDTVGIVNVRVVNPDTTEAVLPKSFTYNNPPTLREIAPNTGPIATDGPIVSVRGMFFQPGVQVFFKNASAKIRSVDAAGQEIVVEVPRSDTPGAVRVRVVNPDEGEARLPEGYTYLSAIQQQRARIRKVSPTAILEQTPTVIDVYGNNVHDAYTNGTFALRTTMALDAKPHKVELKRDPLTQEEIVSFTLVPRLTSGGKLGPLQRAIIEIIASQRKNAVKDGLVETFAMLTCLPQTTPIAISFTASVNQGRTNALVIAGKNLHNTRLRMAQGKEWAGISLEHQFSDDNIALALVSVDNTATIGNFAIELVSDSGIDQPPEQTPNLLPKSLEVTIQRPGNTPGAGNDGSLARLIVDDDDRQAGVAMSPLSAAPEQVALAPTKTDSIAYSLSAAPDAPPSFSNAPATFSGVPDTNSANLVIGARFDVLDLDFEFPLFAYARLVPIFNRGGTDVTDRGVVARLGKVTALRNQTLLLVLDVRLSIQIKVTVFIGFNPFNDIDSPQRFVDPFPTKVLPDNAFGVVVQVFVSTRVSIAASFFVGLLAPDPVTRALTVRQLAAIGFSVTLQGQGRKVDLDRRFVFNVKGLLKPKPLIFRDGGLELLGAQDDLRPDRLGLGFLAYYFARKKGKSCATFDYGTDDPNNDFALEFSSPTNESIIFPPLPNKFQVCVPVRSAAGYRIVRIEPQDILLVPGAQQVVRAFGKRVDENEMPLDDKEDELKFNEVRFTPAEGRPDRPEEDLEGVFSVIKDEALQEWRVNGLKEGAIRKLLASTTTRGPGNAVPPSRPIAFLFPKPNSEPEVADQDNAAKVSVKAVSARVTSISFAPKERNVSTGDKGDKARQVTISFSTDTPNAAVSLEFEVQDQKYNLGGTRAAKLGLAKSSMGPFVERLSISTTTDGSKQGKLDIKVQVISEAESSGILLIRLAKVNGIPFDESQGCKVVVPPQILLTIFNSELFSFDNLKGPEATDIRELIGWSVRNRLKGDQVNNIPGACANSFVQMRMPPDINRPNLSCDKLLVNYFRDQDTYSDIARLGQVASGKPIVDGSKQFQLDDASNVFANDWSTDPTFGCQGYISPSLELWTKLVAELIKKPDDRAKEIPAGFDRTPNGKREIGNDFGPDAAGRRNRVQVVYFSGTPASPREPEPGTLERRGAPLFVLLKGKTANEPIVIEDPFYLGKLEQPTITALAPNCAEPGTTVFIEGQNFAGAAAVRFNGAIALFVIQSATRITAMVPAGATRGPVTVTVGAVSRPNDGRTATSDRNFEVKQVINQITARREAGAVKVTITGTNALKDAKAVRFTTKKNQAPDARAECKVISDTMIEATAPANAMTGPLTVETPQFIIGTKMNYTAPGRGRLRIDDFSPESGQPGMQVMVSGEGFEDVLDVQVDGKSVPFTVDVTNTAMTFVIPQGASSGTISAITADEIVVSERPLRVIPTAAGSVMLSGRPSAQAIAQGTSATYTVALERSDFAGPVELSARGIPSGASAEFSPNPVIGDAATLTITTTAGATVLGAHTVTIYGIAQGEPNVAITPAAVSLAVGLAPTITAVSPTTGSPGANVDILGTNFDNVSEVRFNAAPASFLISSSSRLSATVPQGATTGSISIATPFGTATSDGDFQVTTGNALEITQFTPTSGTLGTPVTISGTGFTEGATVAFNGVPAPVTSISPTEIRTAVPRSATTGLISVMTREGSASSRMSFTVLPPLAKVDLLRTPSTQTIAAGQSTNYTMTLARTNFTGAVDLAISGLPAGATAAFSPDPTTGDRSVLTITTTANTTPGNSMLTISGTAPGVTITPLTVTLTVTLAPSVRLSATPTTQSVTAGQSASYTVALQRTNFTGAVAFAVSGLPAGATAVFRDDPTTGTSAVLTITTTVGTPAGTGPVMISGTAPGATIAPISVSLTVNSPIISLPVISGFTPSRGPVETPVTITGLHFEGATAVTFNGVAAAYTVLSPTAIQATVPAGATTGVIGVTARTATGTSATGTSAAVFTVTPAKDKELKDKEKEKEKESEGGGKGHKDGKDFKDFQEGGKGVFIETAFQARGSLPPQATDAPTAPTGQLRHFISPALRPNLEDSALTAEPDLMAPATQDREAPAAQ